MVSTRQCLFWFAFCVFFVAWDLTFAIVDGGWWVLFFLPLAIFQGTLGVYWFRRWRGYV